MVSELFNKSVEIAKQTYPNLEIKFKNENLAMILLGKLLFFNKEFMTEYASTFNNTVYFPTEKLVHSRPITSVVLLAHELTHLHDFNKMGKLLYLSLYAMPFTLIFLVPFLFMFKWFLGLGLLLFCLSPVPSLFRKQIEMRGYITSLYTIYHLSKKQNFAFNSEKLIESFATQFTGGSYYYMWPFKKMVVKELTNATNAIMLGQNPLNDDTLKVVDNIIENL